MEAKKILIICSYPDSILSFRGPLISQFLKNNFEVHIACPNLTNNPISNELMNLNIHLHDLFLSRASINLFKDIKTIFDLFIIIRSIKPDKVFMYTVKPVIYGLIISSLARVKSLFPMITGLGFAFQNHIISDIEENKEIKPFKKDDNPYSDGEQLNLSFILNLLDGILETPGRILIVTTNYVEKLDKAFIRPGRIDINLEVGYCDLSMIIEMFNFFYEKDCNYLFKNFKYDNLITPAELNKHILNNYNNCENAYYELNQKN